MNLPPVVATIVEAQNNLDHQAYANCFNDDAIVHDEGHTHQGKAEIKEWIKKANVKYQAKIRPLEFSQDGHIAVLEAEVSGTFDGSPVVLKYNMELKGELIQSLEVTG